MSSAWAATQVLSITSAAATALIAVAGEQRLPQVSIHVYGYAVVF
jgi:hypothetical protein